MLSITPTKLNDYLICPQKYKFKHINKNEIVNGSAALSFGRSMHSTLQTLHQSRKYLNYVENISDILANYWEPNAYSDAEESESYFIKGCQALQTYCEKFDCYEETLIGTEVYLSYILKIGNLRVRLGCKADRISVYANKILEIIDYKTNGSGKVPTLDYLQNDLPTFLYYVLARVSYPQYKQIRVTFLNVMTLAKVSVEYDSAQIAANKQSLLECLKTLAVENLFPKPSEACSWCSFQDDCPALGKVFDFADII